MFSYNLLPQVIILTGAAYMSHAMAIYDHGSDDDTPESQYQKGVKHLCENGHLQRVPTKYILPASDRPATNMEDQNVSNQNLRLPIIDFDDLLGPNRTQVLQSLADACEQYGFFQVGNWIHKLYVCVCVYIHTFMIWK